MCLWRVLHVHFGKLSSFLHVETCWHSGNLCRRFPANLSVIIALGKKSQIPALAQCNQAHSEMTFRSRPQSLPQSSHSEYTNQQAVFQCQLMGLSQIIAKGI